VIVKVQLSLYTTAAQRMMLVYNQDRSYQQEVPAPDPVVRLMNGLNKAYFEASMFRGELTLDEQVDDQPW
jgi:hypothetical protein